jgi:hypothetical protein
MYSRYTLETRLSVSQALERLAQAIRPRRSRWEAPRVSRRRQTGKNTYRNLTVKDAELLDTLFREAVAAIDAGDVVTLERLLVQHPRLVRDRLESPGAWLRSQIGEALDGFFRHPYLLWFVTEDAVRTGKLSANVAAIVDSFWP